jgi:predicted transcriptional regulator
MGAVSIFNSSQSESSAIRSGLGPLEARVLELLWDRGRAMTVRHLLPEFPALAYTTLQTTLDRLYRKGLLIRLRKGRAFAFEPRCSREVMLRELVSKHFVDVLAASRASTGILSTLVQCVGQRDAALLDELEALVQAERIRIQEDDK